MADPVVIVTWDDEEGVPVADAKANQFVERFSVQQKQYPIQSVAICNQAVLNEFRLATVKGSINRIIFVYKNETLKFDPKTGRFADWPEGFADTIDLQLNQLLGIS